MLLFSLKDIYYDGIKNQWNKINIDSYCNDDLLKATIHFSTLGYELSLDGTYYSVIGLGTISNTDFDLVIPSTHNGLPVKIIESNVFYYANVFTSFTIPDSITSIGDYAFYGCSSLKNVYYSGTKQQWNEITIGNGNNDLKYATIHYNYSE